MSRPKHSGEALSARAGVARASKNLRSRQDRLDERAIAEANDDSAWEAPVEVKRRGSAGLRAALARHAATQARLHWAREKGSSRRVKTREEMMTKSQLVEEVARVVELTKKQAETIVEVIFDSIVSVLRSGQPIERREFSVRGRNVHTHRKAKTEKDRVQPKTPFIKTGNAKRGRIARLDRPAKSGPNQTPRPS